MKGFRRPFNHIRFPARFQITLSLLFFSLSFSLSPSISLLNSFFPILSLSFLSISFSLVFFHSPIQCILHTFFSLFLFLSFSTLKHWTMLFCYRFANTFERTDCFRRNLENKRCRIPNKVLPRLKKKYKIQFSLNFKTGWKVDPNYSDKLDHLIISLIIFNRDGGYF